MNSSGTQECFVYITLPGAVSPVTAGMFFLERGPRNNALGHFAYDRSYLENPEAVEVDPVELKLAEGIYETMQLNGVFGALRDASPDFWGRRIIDKRVGIVGLVDVDYLLESPDDHAGAISFGLSRVPPAPPRRFNQTIDLERLQLIAEALAQDEIPNDPNAEQVQDLLLLGTSIGGARPKTVIQDGESLWIVKFAGSGDRWNFPRVEHAMLELARQCGIDAAESRIETIGGKDVLLIKRFDRQKTPDGYTRSRVISGLTALRADEAPTTRERWSYVLLAEELRRIVSDPKAGAPDGILRKGPEVKYAFIQRHNRIWPIRVQCRVLGVSVSGYHQHLGRRREMARRRHLSDEALLAHIRAAYAENRGAYGWPRIWRQLRAQGIRVGKQRVQRLMQQHGIRARGKRRFRVTTTDSGHNLPIAPNLLNRNFTPAAPNQTWASDITYIATEEGWLFLAVVIDLFSRRVVGWSMQPDMRRNLVIDALEMAWFQRRPDQNNKLIFHSDRGSQYASDDFNKVLKEYAITPSMSGKGNCWDNACSETLFGSLKVERLHGQRFETIRQAKDETIAWLLWYNQTRMHSTLCYASPIEFENEWGCIASGAAREP